MSKQLRLVTDALHAHDASANAAKTGPIERVFSHWVFMLGKHPLRTRIDSERRTVLTKALALYDEETLKLAIDGCAGSPWHAGENDRGRPFNDIELILRSARNIERFAEMGEQLHHELRQHQVSDSRSAPRAEMTPEQAAAQREALKAHALRKIGRA